MNLSRPHAHHQQQRLRRILGNRGFTLVELMVATGLAAVLMIGTITVTENLQRSKATAIAKGSMTDIRTMVFSVLKNLSTNCAQVVLPSPPSVDFSAITTGLAGSTPVIIMLNSQAGSPILLSDGMTIDGAAYSVRLSGTLSHTITASPSHPQATNVYHGIITLIADKTKIGLGTAGHNQLGAPKVTVAVPISFEIIPASKQMYSCSAIGTDIELAGGQHSLYDCESLGGTGVIVNGTGRACVFTQLNFTVNSPAALVCPSFNTGCADAVFPANPATQCQCTDTPAEDVYPPACPTGATPASPPTLMYSGNYYCQYTTDPGACSAPTWVSVLPAAAPPSPPAALAPVFFCEMGPATCPAPQGTPVTTTDPPYCHFPGSATGSCPSPGTNLAYMSGTTAICNLTGTVPVLVLGCPAGAPPWTIVPASPYNNPAAPPYSSITCE